MNTMSSRAGNIMFQDSIIKVQKPAQTNDVFFGAHSPKLPTVIKPLQYSAKPRPVTKLFAEYKPMKIAKGLEELVLPPVRGALNVPVSPLPPKLLCDVSASPTRSGELNHWADARPRPRRSFRCVGFENKVPTEINLAKVVPGGALLCRYDEHDVEFAKHVAVKEAARRRTVAQQVSAMQRTRAHKKEEHRKHLEQEITVIDEDDPDLVNTLNFQSNDDATSDRSSTPETVRPNRRASVRTTLSANRATILDRTSDPQCSDVLQKVKLKSPKAMRMAILSKTRARMQAEAQVRIRMEEQQREFEALPLFEQEALERAYRLGTEKGNTETQATNAQLLEHYHHAPKVAADQPSKLYNCLLELGLNGRRDVEHREIKLLCHEAEKAGDVDFYGFVFDVVPSARAKLIDLHQDSLAEQFTYYDHDNNGYLDKDECSDMLTKLCRNMDQVGLEGVRQEFETVFDRVKLVETDCANGFSEYLDFEGFQDLYERVHEKYECLLQNRMYKLIEEHKLSSVEAKSYAEELLVLYDTFVQADRGGHSYLDLPEVFGALLEHGLIPNDATERKQVERMVEAALSGSSSPGRLSFHSFLDLIKMVREAGRVQARPQLSAYFKECDKDGNGKLSFAEARVIFAKLGMVPECREDQDELKNMLLKVDIDGSGDLDFQEFTHLVQQVIEKIRTNERRRTNQVAKQLGFSEEQVAELREIFFNLDSNGDGGLGIEECRKALTLLHLDMPADQLKSLFLSIDKARVGNLDLTSFFFFVDAISKIDAKVWIKLKKFMS